MTETIGKKVGKNKITKGAEGKISQEPGEVKESHGEELIREAPSQKCTTNTPHLELDQFRMIEDVDGRKDVTTFHL